MSTKYNNSPFYFIVNLIYLTQLYSWSRFILRKTMHIVIC